jgi:hypothetical protein
MAPARSCALTAVAPVLATWQGRQADTVRRQLRECRHEAAANQGQRRQDVRVEPCCAPRLRRAPAGDAGRPVALAPAATPLGSRFVVLAIGGVDRGGAIPVAWAVLPAGDEGARRPERARLLGLAAPAGPAGWPAIVLADRGPYARWLCQAIAERGRHPSLRVNRGGASRPAGLARFYPRRRFAPTVGQRWQGRGTACSTSR